MIAGKCCGIPSFCNSIAPLLLTAILNSAGTLFIEVSAVFNTADTSINNVPAEFRIAVNNKGAMELQKEGIPQHFPAIISHSKQDYKFWYFCADFCDNPINKFSSYFKGVSFFRRMF